MTHLVKIDLQSKIFFLVLVFHNPRVSMLITLLLPESVHVSNLATLSRGQCLVDGRAVVAGVPPLKLLCLYHTKSSYTSFNSNVVCYKFKIPP